MTQANGYEIQVLDANPHVGLNPQDLASVGAALSTHGFTQLQVQGLIGRIQKVAAQVAISTIQEALEDIRRIQEARFMEIVQMIRTMRSMGGYVRMDQVIQIIQMVAAKTPRQ
jgi:hypothetical protein